MKALKIFAGDPRHFQILTLGSLLVLQIFWADFGPEPFTVLAVFAVALLTQFAFCTRLNLPFDFRSPLISALSLSILLKASIFWVLPLAAFVAVASKFFVRFKGRHIFNPANIGIVAMLILFPQMSWVSPGQWGSAVWLAFLLTCFALLVLFKIPRRDMALLFLGSWAALLFARAFWLGDPLAIPFHQLQNGALLIFSFFMISDPKTIPNGFAGRAIFALAVSVLAFILQFEFQIREGLFYALAVVCLVRPVLDEIWNAASYEWGSETKLKGEYP